MAAAQAFYAFVPILCKYFPKNRRKCTFTIPLRHSVAFVFLQALPISAASRRLQPFFPGASIPTPARLVSRPKNKKPERLRFFVRYLGKRRWAWAYAAGERG